MVVLLQPALHAQKNDWLVKPPSIKAQVIKSADGKELTLYNGLLKRVFRISPDVGCISYENLTIQKELLRAVKPEAILTINGKVYNLGGLYGQTENAYLLPDEVVHLRPGEDGFKCTGYAVTTIKAALNWKSRMWMPKISQATGKTIVFHYVATVPELAGLNVDINYELYDGIPLINKSLIITNLGSMNLKLNRVKNEILGMAEEEGPISTNLTLNKPPQGLYIESNYAFNNNFSYPYSDQSTHWEGDSTYVTKVGEPKAAPVLLEVYEDDAPGVLLAPGDTVHSVRTNELMMDSYDREARGLAVRKMYAVIAPWVTENPIFMHLITNDDREIMTAIDQCAATGYEAIIISFGSDLNMEDTSAANLLRWKNIADYAHSKNIKLGCYALFSSRHISESDDIINPKTGKTGGTIFGNAPCFGSKWGLGFRDKIKAFFIGTGFDIWENDGPYPGDICASTSHPGHKNVDDSQWAQVEIQKELYHWLNHRGVYINSPDWYFLDGSNKIAMGYREENFSLPRAQQKILNRQNIYDATWEKMPSMGWGFVPLTEYHGGGSAATIEPLSQHLDDYEQLMMQYYGAGIQACYRGPRLYDTPTTKKLVTRVIKWYKKYREILNSNIIHLRRADGKEWDGIMHANPGLKDKGLVMLYNPTDQPIHKTINLPLFYTGLTRTAFIQEKDSRSKIYRLNRDYDVEYPVTIPAQSYTWLLIR